MAIMVLAAAACDEEEHNSEGSRCNTVIDHYLYGVEYDDYDFNACLDYINKQYIPTDYGCSEVRKGKFVGRNLDWYINRNASAVIKVNRTKDHYASIGVVGCFPQFSEEVAQTGQYDEVYQYLPFKTCDGINECGLYVGVNVMPTGETSFDRSKWRPNEYGLGAAFTNPESDKTYAVNYLTRILLDKASSVQEAMRIVDGINWTEPVNFPYPGSTQALHWLICDEKESVVLEFMDNKAYYTQAESVDEPSYGTIMTNFTNCLMEEGVMQQYGCGYERWDILRDNYASTPETFEGMENLMRSVWYSKLFKVPDNPDDTWYSEMSSYIGKAAWDLYKHYELAQDKDFQDVCSMIYGVFQDKSNWYKDDTPLWFSTHTSVYNLQSRELHILVHEGYDGMKTFHAFPFNSRFEKPLDSAKYAVD